MNTVEQQYYLAEFGYYKAKVDGIEGPQTRSARSSFLAFHGYNFGPAHPRTKVAAEQLIMNKIAGWDIDVDGLVGPQTSSARVKWEKTNWRDPLNQELKGDDRFPMPVKMLWPMQSQMESYYGKPGTGLVTFKVPYTLTLAWDKSIAVGKITAHTKVRESTERVLERVLDDYGLDAIKELGLNLYGGTYNNRVMRGGSQLSTHAYGIAHDFDPERNQLNWGRDRAQFAKTEYNKWWDAWTDEGWLSLGKARNYDWMHVQAARLG